MLKSTHRPAPPPQPVSQPPLPPGWTEHTAPTGHKYYYEAATNTSTYTRPQFSPLHQFVPAVTYGPTNTLQAPTSTFNTRSSSKPSYQLSDKPKSKHVIPGCAPWLLVKTRLGRRFAHNPSTGESIWKFPQEVIGGVVEYDIQEREKKDNRHSTNESPQVTAEENVPGLSNANLQSDPSSEATKNTSVPQPDTTHGGKLKSTEFEDYEEIEIVEEDDVEEEEKPSKRQRLDSTDSPSQSARNEQLEFGEDDMAYQLAQMGGAEAEYDDEYDDWGGDLDPVQVDDAATIEESKSAFKDLFDDYNVSPFTTWEKVIGEGDIIDDERYTLLPNMRSRKELFEQWSGTKIKSLKEQQERQARQDPRIPYLAMLQKKATPKLFWPEFKRKYKKEPEMRDLKLSDKDREKLYREYINRITKAPESTRKEELQELLKSLPPSKTWNSHSSPSGTLPSSLQASVKFISLKAEVRDQIIEDFIQKLPEPESLMTESEKSELQHKRLEQRKRDDALRERVRQVEEAKKSQQRKLTSSRSTLENEREELGRALNVGREGLLSNFEHDSETKV